MVQRIIRWPGVAVVVAVAVVEVPRLLLHSLPLHLQVQLGLVLLKPRHLRLRPEARDGVGGRDPGDGCLGGGESGVMSLVVMVRDGGVSTSLGQHSHVGGGAIEALVRRVVHRGAGGV